ncbi:TetR/AcrR family transcriptional regulator [Zavarzinia sp. CC-PAN008]|uniref:TetR/AcrR family transcriptional regulator n=1 Tax=Zavarzinia sp. CC-PAN008 TaxID=3243332 RepID=UPI003F74982C
MSETARANPRAERTRAALIAAGRRLFGARAADAVTVDEIVQAAGVGKGSFYNHFADRDGLLRAITAEIRGAVEQAVGQANAAVADPAARVVRAMCTYLRYALDEPERAAVLARMHGGHTSLQAPLNRGLVDDIAQGLASGRFAVATSEAGVLYVLGVTQIALLHVLDDPNPRGTVALAQQMCGLVLRGFGLPPAEADRLAAQASDEVVRQGAFTVARPPDGPG